MAKKFSKEEETEMLAIAEDWNKSLEKERISPYLPKKIVEELKSRAKRDGKPYNIYLQDILENIFYPKENDLALRVAKLEQAVFKKAN